MRRIFQFVALTLALLLLAPEAFASVICKAPAHPQACSKSCCAGMDDGTMQMDGDVMTAGNTTQISPSPCCVVTVTNAMLTAAQTSAPESKTTALAPTAVVVLAALPMPRKRADELPPGLFLRQPTPSRLCTFLI
ncbi:hypothetical protein ACOBR2_17285 [Telmatobacter bradus]|uniref:hypothetical protein n=1 Tax=Telmatobacter bradus TaxID=474953 RepID=UPI003B42D25F